MDLMRLDDHGVYPGVRVMVYSPWTTRGVDVGDDARLSASLVILSRKRVDNDGPMSASQARIYLYGERRGRACDACCATASRTLGLRPARKEQNGRSSPILALPVYLLPILGYDLCGGCSTC